MKINTSKNKAMKIERTEDEKALEIQVEDVQLQQVKSCKYLDAIQ
jgi:hypothetical protein